MIWAKNFFENMFHRSEITAQSFEKTVLKKRPQYERTSKIHSRGWQAWRNWFFTLTNFLDPVIYWSFFKISWIEKMTGAKKVIKVKNQFFHARQPREGIFKIHSYWGLIFTTVCLNFEQLFRIGETFFQKIFWLKSLQMFRTLTGYMCSENRQP